MIRARRLGVVDAVVALCLLLFAAAPAATAAPSMAIVPAEGTAAPLGPSRAKGVIIWSHGRSVDAEDSRVPTPDYIRNMRNAGWDVLRFQRLRRDDALSVSGGILGQAAAELKDAGYARVVLAGHSFGGFVSLIAATRTDAVDAVIATAPAAYGNALENPGTFRLNASRLFELLERVRRARVALTFFEGDIYDPGGRAAIAERLLDRRGLPHLLIDRPTGLASHWAADTETFAQRFAPCLKAFAEDDAARGTLACSETAPTAGPALARTAQGTAG